VKDYIGSSTHLTNNIKEQDGEQLPPWMRADSKQDRTKGLSSWQYFYLVELLVLKIYLPSEGYSLTC
jgi:hypothetical protein